ncbi:MAG: ABC transporter substrate-binding protein, partial [Bacteroidales bacterium]
VRGFIKTVASLKIAAPRQFIYRTSTSDLQMILKEIDQYDVEAIVLLGKPELASDIMPLLQQRNMKQTIFGSLAVMDDQKAYGPEWSILEGMNLVTSGHWFTESGIEFQKAFQESFGYQPGAVAAYAYDGINLIIEVIKRSEPDRDRIIDAFAEMTYKIGITGEIRFDSYGNRIGIPDLMTVKNGIPIIIHRDD